MAEHKFKIGDWVIAHPSTTSPYMTTSDGWIGEVVKLEGDGRFKAESRLGSDGIDFVHLEERYFDLYEGQRSLLAPRVGDTVVAHKYTPYGTTTNGWTGVVVKVHDSGHIDVEGEGKTTEKCVFTDKKLRYFDLVKKPFYDPKYLEDGNVKKIESLADAIFILCEHNAQSCSGNCRTCAIRMFEKEKGCTCSKVLDDAKKYLRKKLSMSDRKDTPEDFDKLYGVISGASPDIPAPKKEEPKKKTKSEKTELKLGTCKKCKKCRKIGGIPFCYAWHNWTVENGSCFMFEDKTGKIKGEATFEDGSIETSDIVIEVHRVKIDEQEIPF